MDWRNGNTDILDMAFITQNLITHDPQFQIGVDLGSDHLPIVIQHHIGTPSLNPPGINLIRLTKKCSNQYSRKRWAPRLSGYLSTSDLDRYSDFIITALHTAVDKAIPKSKSV